MNATAVPTFVEVEYDPDCTPQQFAEVLASLDRWSVRTQDHVTYLRKCERHDYRTSVVVARCEVPPLAGTPVSKLMFQVMGRNLSQSGLGFLSPPVFVPRLLSDETPLVRGEFAFRLGIEVNVKLVPKVGPPLLVRASVTRIRPVQGGFTEVGIAFIEREQLALFEPQT